MLLPQPQLRNSLLAAGLSVLALGMNAVAADATGNTNLMPVPGAGGAVIDTSISLKAGPAPTPFEKAAEREPVSPPQPEIKAVEASKSAIPEPAAAALGLIGLGLIVFRRYRV